MRPCQNPVALGRKFFALSALLFLCATLLVGCGSTAIRTNDTGEFAALRQVVEVFRTSIINKDKPAFMDLFHSAKPEEITWQAVVDDASLATIKLSRPQAIKARLRPDNNFVAFIDGVVASSIREEGVFTDVHIDTDGEVASVSFDYVYLSAAKTTNSGREKWLLVRAEQGWKIT